MNKDFLEELMVYLVKNNTSNIKRGVIVVTKSRGFTINGLPTYDSLEEVLKINVTALCIQSYWPNDLGKLYNSYAFSPSEHYTCLGIILQRIEYFIEHEL